MPVMEISDFCHYLLSISKLRHVKKLKPAFREIVPLPPPRCYEFDVKCKSFYKIANILYSEDLYKGQFSQERLKWRPNSHNKTTI